MEEKISKDGQFNEEQVLELKKKHGRVWIAEADDAVAYFRKPTRQEVSYAISLLNNNKMVEFIEHVLTSCYIGGSKRFTEDIDYMLGASAVVQDMVKAKTVEVKNA